MTPTAARWWRDLKGASQRPPTANEGGHPNPTAARIGLVGCVKDKLPRPAGETDGSSCSQSPESHSRTWVRLYDPRSPPDAFISEGTLNQGRPVRVSNRRSTVER